MRTVVKMSCSRSVGSRPTTPVQVMSYQTAAGSSGEFAPDVDEDEVAFADAAGVGGGGFVVGVGGVGAGADVGAVLPDQIGAPKAFLKVLHHGEFGGAAVAGAGADLFPGGVEDLVDVFLRDVVGGELRVGEDGFEMADEIGGGDEVFAEGAEEFDGAGVDHGDVHDGVAGGVLHGDFCCAGEESLELGFEFLPGGVGGLWCRGGCRGGRIRCGGRVSLVRRWRG